MQEVRDVVGRPGFRRAASNFGWLAVERVVRFGFGTVVGLLVARHLGPERFGTLSYCVALVTLAGVVPALGLDALLRRQVVQDPARAADWLLSALVLRAAAGLMLVLGVLAASGAGLGLAGEEAGTVAVLALLLLQPALFTPEPWLHAGLHGRWVALTQIGALAVAGVVRLRLIAADARLAAFAWVLVAEMGVTAVGFWLASRRLGLAWAAGRPTWATARRLLGEAWPLLCAGLAVAIYMKIDEVMLRHLAGPGVVGVYAAAVKLSELSYFVPTALAASVLPALLRSRGEASGYARRQQQYYDLSAALAYGFAVPCALLAPWLVGWAYGERYAGAAPVLAVHAWAAVFVFLGVARAQWLVNEGLTRFYLAATCAGAVVNILLNLLLIPRWGGVGAAWATVAAQALASWLVSYLHPAVRPTAAMQTRALLLPLRGWTYLRRPARAEAGP